jgi:hypothetical protein
MQLFEGNWIPVSTSDNRARGLFARHYSFRHKGKAIKPSTITAPGEHLVLLTQNCDALFVWVAERIRHDNQTGINCAVFRNESKLLASELIKEADALAWVKWPHERLFTYVDGEKINRFNDRHKRNRPAGYCFLKAGWRYILDNNGEKLRSSKGLYLLEMYPEWA